MKVLLSRVDSIGDVILTLPMAGIIKKFQPYTTVAFLGNSDTRPLIEKCRFIDEYYNWTTIEEQKGDLRFIAADTIIHVFPQSKIAKVAKKSGIKTRIATSHRLYHWGTCNKLIHFGRKKSDLNEAQLNLMLLKGIGIKIQLSLQELPDYYGWSAPQIIPQQVSNLLSADLFNLILHPKSKGNAQEWPPDKFYALAQELPQNKYRIFISGTAQEGEELQKQCPDIFKLPHVVNIGGKFNLEDFITFVQCADGLLACSTGPLHIAAASGINALGLYPSVRPMNVERWGPIGKRASWIVDVDSQPAKGNNIYLNDIPVQQVKNHISSWEKIKHI